jgi:DNA-binding PadR family transcriptional regulator
MSELTPLGIAALGLLAERPMHPYEMYQTLITRAEDRLVKVRAGSLYHTVDRLTRLGFVEAVGTDREGNRPERTTYRITEAGQLGLSESVARILATPVNEYTQFPLGVAQAHNLSKEIFVELLGRRRVRLVSELETLRGGRTDVQQKSVPKKYWLDITYEHAIVNAEIAWVDGILTDLRSGELDWNETKHHKKETSND